MTQDSTNAVTTNSFLLDDDSRLNLLYVTLYEHDFQNIVPFQNLIVNREFCSQITLTRSYMWQNRLVG